MKKRILLIVACLAMACNPVAKEEKAEEQIHTSLNNKEELGAIEDLRQNFQQAIKEKRYSDLGVMATKDMIGVVPASEEWKAYREFREKPMGMFSYDSIIMSPKETVILNDTMAYDFGTSKVYYTNPDGIAVELEDTFMVLLKKEEGSWKIFREIASGTVK